MEVLEVGGLISLKVLKCNKEQHLQLRTESTHVFVQCTFYATRTHAHTKIQIRLLHSEHTNY